MPEETTQTQDALDDEDALGELTAQLVYEALRYYFLRHAIAYTNDARRYVWRGKTWTIGRHGQLINLTADGDAVDVVIYAEE